MIRCEGTAFECGENLGEVWRCEFAGDEKIWSSSEPWWRVSTLRPLVDKYAPHLPDLFRGIAKGAKLPEYSIGGRTASLNEGCTSFAVSPKNTIDGFPISGQTKDTPSNRINRYRILNMKLTDAPSMLSLTYPGWLFGHGFVEGGCAVFRNSLYAGVSRAGVLGYAQWGLLATHCSTAGEAAGLAVEYGVRGVSAHCVIQDCAGGVVGLEIAEGGNGLLSDDGGVLVHANHVESGDEVGRFEKIDPDYLENSKYRKRKLFASLSAVKPELEARMIMKLLADHENYPEGICNHAREDYQTTAAVVAEPAKGLLHVLSGPPCRGELTTHSIN